MVQREKCLQKETIVYFHGGGGNLGLRMDYFAMLYNEMHVNILAVAFRGFAPSKGTASEKTMEIDARAIIKFAKTLKDFINPDKVYLMGRSIGASVALR